LDASAPGPGVAAGAHAEGSRRADRGLVSRGGGRRDAAGALRSRRRADRLVREAMAGCAGAVSGRACLGCAAALGDPFLDLGSQPFANALLRPEDTARPEPRFPLAVAYCARCHLVQLTETAPPEALFGEYLYFSSYSESFLAHARAMADALVARFALGPERRLLEIGSNDGYLLRFVQ